MEPNSSETQILIAFLVLVCMTVLGALIYIPFILRKNRKAQLKESFTTLRKFTNIVQEISSKRSSWKIFYERIEEFANTFKQTKDFFPILFLLIRAPFIVTIAVFGVLNEILIRLPAKGDLIVRFLFAVFLDVIYSIFYGPEWYIFLVLPFSWAFSSNSDKDWAAYLNGQMGYSDYIAIQRKHNNWYFIVVSLFTLFLIIARAFVLPPFPIPAWYFEFTHTIWQSFRDLISGW